MAVIVRPRVLSFKVGSHLGSYYASTSVITQGRDAFQDLGKSLAVIIQGREGFWQLLYVRKSYHSRQGDILAVIVHPQVLSLKVGRDFGSYGTTTSAIIKGRGHFVMVMVRPQAVQ